MKPIGLDEICRALQGRWLQRSDQQVATGITTDTRAAGRGQLFFAIRGDRFDGHDFLGQAREAGCAAAVVASDARQLSQAVRTEGMGLLVVRDTRRALRQLASFYRGQVAADVIAVTGSNGKTTVKRMIHHVLSRRLRGSCSPKSYNNEIGVPLTLLEVGGADDYVVCEVGSSSPGEIESLGSVVRPDIAVITSVGPTHLEKLGTVERVAAEKASLIGSLVDDGLAVVWADSELLVKAIRFYNRRVIKFGLAADAELRLTGWEPRGTGQRFQLNGRLWAELPLPGRHNAINALAAIAVGQRFGFSQEESAAALADFPGIEMRLQQMAVGSVTIINDAYNANPASVAAAADALAGMEGRRRVMVIGDMLELGQHAEALHMQAGRDIAARPGAPNGRGVDLLIGVGPLGRYIAQGAAESRLATQTYESVRDASAHIAGVLSPGDVVLIKGSRAMGMESLVEPIRQAFGGPGGPEKAKTLKGVRR